MRTVGAFRASPVALHLVVFSVKDDERSGGWGLALCGESGPMLSIAPDAPRCSAYEVASLGLVPQPLSVSMRDRIWKMRQKLVCRGCGKLLGETPCSPGFEAFAQYGACPDCAEKFGVPRPVGGGCPLSPIGSGLPRPEPPCRSSVRTSDKGRRVRG